MVPPEQTNIKPEPETELPAPPDAGALQKLLEEEKTKAEKYLANWQRAQADFQNYKKFCEQERGQTVKFACCSAILAVLPALDDLERALAQAAVECKEACWLEGFEAVGRKLKSALEAQGLTEIKALGETFDPNLHEAVRQAEGKEGLVLEEVQKGYKLYDRVLRPSMVVVGAGEAKETEKET